MTNTVQQLIDSLGHECILTGTGIGAKYHADGSGEAAQAPIAVARPASTEQVSQILQLCHRNRQKVVVQGGLTGLCGGATPQENEIALSLERLTGIEELDRDAMTMTVLAGTPLQLIQEAAHEAGLLFPLDLGARGSCTIGGNIATNAGGNEVIRFGMTRNLVLGLEVVLADGTVISSLNKMLKNNAGYDLKHLFIGTEGTLGIATRAVLRLFPASSHRSTALVALESFTGVIAFLHLMNREFGGALSSFEAMWDSYYDYIIAHVSGVQGPFDKQYPVYVLTETEGADEQTVKAQFEKVLSTALEQGQILDAVICQSERERQQLWAIRDGVGDIPELVRRSANFDISVPVREMAAFLGAVETALQELLPGTLMMVFGHVGDSNLHLIFDVDDNNHRKMIYNMVYDQVGQHDGSISAEHGIGVQKRPYLDRSRTAEEITLMKILKQALDPEGILNAGRVID